MNHDTSWPRNRGTGFQPFLGFNGRFVALLVLASFSFTACKKAAAPVTQTASATADPSAAIPLQPANIAGSYVPARIPQDADPGAAVGQLSLELKKFVLRTRIAP